MIVIQGSRIRDIGPRATTNVPANAVVIDAQGKFVIPGLADMHNHLLSGSFRLQQDLRNNLRRLLALDITTVFDPSISKADFTAFKAAAASDTAPFARFYGTGPIVTVKGDTLGAMVGSPTPETVAQAQTTVSDLKAAGVDAIKVNRDDASWSMKGSLPLMKLEVLTALVKEAHQQGLN